jgi:vancomycin resistance protein YoaR
MATTLFNAAWFAGLDFGEYQSHSLYISRYPYGREATMGYPHPDLEVKNTTPYGILLWPTYTERSLTVSMYSTKYYESVTMSAQTKRPQGTCTVVRSERTRVLLDGERKVDSTSARYRAREGLNCDGSQAPPPKEG